MTEFWIPFTTTSDWTSRCIEQSLDACHAVHMWTTITLRERFLETLEIPTDLELRLNLTMFIYLKRLKKSTQRYTLNRVVEQAASEFRKQIRMGEENRVVFPAASLRQNYDELTLQARKIWGRYLEKYGGISTTYGMLMLEENWKYSILKQAEQLGVALDYLPYILHSATVRQNEEQHLLRFNFLDPKSVHGKKARRKFNLEK